MKTKLTHKEVGAFLIAVGQQMIKCNVCAAAAVDGNADDDLIKAMMENGVTKERAEQLCELDLYYAVDFNEIEG